MSEIFDLEYLEYTTAPYSSNTTTCPHCGGKTVFEYTILYHNEDETTFNFKDCRNSYGIAATCPGCKQLSLYFKDSEDFKECLAFPIKNTNAPTPNKDMPDNVKTIFNESLNVIPYSPRASIALSRLAIDLLTIELNAEGATLNERIGFLVKQGLPTKIQQALDSVRVIGNNAVHPGNIIITENDENLALSLLHFINIIVDYQISQPKQLEETYNLLPQNYRKAIDGRDS